MIVSRARVKTVLQVLVMVGLLTYLGWNIDFDQLMAVIGDVRVGWLLGPFLLGIALLWLNAFRWQLLLQTATDENVPLWRLAYSDTVGQFFGVFLPSDTGSDVFRIYDLSRMKYTVSQSAISVLSTRGFGLLAQGLLIGFGLLTAREFIIHDLVLYITVAYAVLTAGLSLVIIDWRVLELLVQRGRSLGEARNKHVASVAVLAQETISMLGGRRTVGLSLFLAVCHQLIIVAILYFYGLAIGLSLPLSGLVLVSPLIGLISALPLSINALGLREGAFVYFMARFGATNEQGLLLALLVRLILGGVFPLLGGLLFLVFGRPLPSR